MIFRTAKREDDANILKFLNSSPSDGKVQVHLRRVRSFFDSIRVFGDRSDVLLLENEKESEILGVGIYSEKSTFINNDLHSTGYLSELRLSPKVKKRGHLARGYRELKNIMNRGTASISYTTIMGGNDEAESILTSRRAGLPFYKRIADYRTIFLGAKKCFFKSQGHDVRMATSDDVPELVAFYQQYGRQKNFFPSVTEEELLSINGVYQGISYSDFFIALDDDKIVGAVALWDQSQFRSWFVAHYDFKVALFRILYNAYAYFTGAPFFPKKQRDVRYKTLSLICAKDNDRSIFESLFNFIWKKTTLLKGLDLVMLGVTSNDSLGELLECPHHEFKSSVYTVSWDENALLIDDRPIYIELGTL